MMGALVVRRLKDFFEIFYKKKKENKKKEEWKREKDMRRKTDKRTFNSQSQYVKPFCTETFLFQCFLVRNGNRVEIRSKIFSK